MSTAHLFGAALLAVASASLASSCSTNVSDTPPEMWCSEAFGNVRSAADTFHLYGGTKCSANEICANTGDLYYCCDLGTDPTCASRGDGMEDAVYCGNAGWSRLPNNGHGSICAPNETCALRTGNFCQTVCCDPREDPKCGVPSEKCGSA